jgi:hypothetical protein
VTTQFEQNLRQQLRSQEYQLDPAISERLQQARHQAVARARFKRWPRFLVPTFAMATASMVAAILVWSPVDGTHHGATNDNFPAEHAELYEDLDFYYWLAESQINHRS